LTRETKTSSTPNVQKGHCTGAAPASRLFCGSSWDEALIEFDQLTAKILSKQP
jgi:hypothetical protein